MKKFLRRGISLAVSTGGAASIALIVCGTASAAAPSMYDVDGDGYVDSSVSDTSNNGICDQNVIIVNGTYLWLKDANENWAPDQYGFDTNGDYSPDTWAMDANEDRVVEGFFSTSASWPTPGPFADLGTQMQQVLRSNPSWSIGPYGGG